MRERRLLLELLFRAGIAAVEPAALVARRVRRVGKQLAVEGAPASWGGPTVVVGAGKASARMAAAVAGVIGRDLAGGLVVAPRGPREEIPGIAVRSGGHPLPSDEGEQSTRALIWLLQERPEAAVVALISGGASSLLIRPIPPLVLADLIATNEALLASGARIHEINTVRKHLDNVKGGGLIRIARGRPFVTLILSDVIGDDPVTIGSGPTCADPTTFADAVDVVERYQLRRSLPPAVIRLLEAGTRGELPETLKPGAEELAGVVNLVIGSNRDALEAAAVAARRAGYEPVIADEPLVGDTMEAAQKFAGWVLRRGEVANRPLCLLAGGETTVRLGASPGRGGRNQEFGLACARAFDGRSINLLSAGTDGVDGPTDAAGAWVDGSTLERARRLGLDAAAALAGHDSYAFFDALGDLFRPGPTGTNVMDIKIALIGKPS